MLAGKDDGLVLAYLDFRLWFLVLKAGLLFNVVGKYFEFMADQLNFAKIADRLWRFRGTNNVI